LQLVRPGDFVDLVTVDKRGEKSSVLLQKVLVLATGLDTTAERSAERGRIRARVLTVSVSLAEAQLLGLAQTSGHLMAVVRNSSDPRVTVAPQDVTSDALYDVKQRTEVAKATEKRPVKLEHGVN
jgi:Flp pilus assembly protein CpaB